MVVNMDIKSYAIINSKTHIVENVIIWDGRTEPLEIKEPEIIEDEQGNKVETGNMIIVQILPRWMPPVNTYVICIDGTEAGIGWIYNEGEFQDVRFPPEETIEFE
jgi:hypothetical protein